MIVKNLFPFVSFLAMYRYSKFPKQSKCNFRLIAAFKSSAVSAISTLIESFNCIILYWATQLFAIILLQLTPDI